jgi:hypothetical protein
LSAAPRLFIASTALKRKIRIGPRGWKIQAGVCRMKPITAALIGVLVVALAVVGYLYYQRTANDITIQPPKIELKP